MAGVRESPSGSTAPIHSERGFPGRFRYQSHSCARAKVNMKSASDNLEVVDRYIEREVQVRVNHRPGRSQGVAYNPDSCFGVIPKNHKWRLLEDLSHPEGASINEGIELELCTMRHTSVDEAMARVCALGARAQLAKFVPARSP